MTVTETNISCTICKTFKRLIYEGVMPDLEDWEKFTVEVEGSTKTRYICPTCQDTFHRLFDKWLDEKTISAPPSVEVKTPEEVIGNINQPQPRKAPKKRGRPPKKKD